MSEVDHVVHIEFLHVVTYDFGFLHEDGACSNAFFDVPNNAEVFVDDGAWDVVGVFEFISL